MLLGFGLQVLHVDIAVGVAAYRDDLHAGHRCRSGVGTVCRRGDQDDVAVALAPALVVGADDHQPCVFARGARIGLQRAGGQSGDRGQVGGQPVDQFAVAFGLVGGSERVHVLEPGERQGLHEGCGVEFHGAGAERDHRICQRDVAQLEAFDVTHQVAFAAVGIEDAFGQELRLAQDRGRDGNLLRQFDGLGFFAFGLGEDGDYLVHLLGGGHVVERETNPILRRIEEVDAAFERQRLYAGGFRLYFERVEEVLGRQFVVHRFERLGYRYGCRVGRLGRAAQTFGAVIDAVEADHRSHQRRSGADVRGGTLALDVLFAGLERHAERTVAQTVDRYADDAARHVALVRFARGHVAGARAAEAHRDAETLGRADDDVGPPFARSLQQGQRQQVGNSRYQGAFGMGRFGEGGVVAHLAVGGGVLYDGAELLAGEFICIVVVDHQFDAEWLAAGDQYVERLGEDVAIDEKLVASLLDRFARAEREHHQHRFGGCGAFVQQRTVADLHACQRNDGGLEVQQRLEASLRNLGLIGSVRSVPSGVLEDVARDGGRYGAGVVTHADERTQGAILGCEGLDVIREFVFAHALGQGERLFQADRLRNDLCDELIDGFDADHGEHRFQILGIGDADMAVGKFIKHRILRMIFYDL